MGTRGTIGFRLKEKDYLTYNHYDSYPDGLGVAILADLRLVNIEELKKLAGQVKLVDEDDTPTEEDIFALKKYTDTTVGQTIGGDNSKPNWYQLTRELQGELISTIKAGYMADNENFIKDSLFCEWGYIVNFDENVLEVYRGFQKVKENVYGRYKDHEPEKGDSTAYYACSLIKTYPLDSLPTDKDFIKDVTPID